MALITIEKKELKELVKSELTEILSSRNDLLEVLEDIGLSKLIDKGLKTKSVKRQVIMKTLVIKE